MEPNCLMKGKFLLFMLVLMLSSCSFETLYKMRQRQKINVLEQVDLQKLITLYMNKNETSVGTVEGVYSVSGLVTRTGRGLLGGSEEKDRVLDRKENYAKVAIMRDPKNASREYFELMLDKEMALSFSVIGEFSGMSDGNILVYKHFENKGKRYETYTFTYDSDKGILEGIRTENTANATVTYKLTYLKILPKGK
jgi:hypothetical protein